MVKKYFNDKKNQDNKKDKNNDEESYKILRQNANNY